VSGHAKMPPASHQVSATSFKLLIQQIHPHVRVERDSGMCVARDLYELWGHPHVCGPHVALEVGDHLMLFKMRRRSQVSLFLARVGRTCTLDRRVDE
jgi:hypothetical protein